jgi:hypothetical protein
VRSDHSLRSSAGIVRPGRRQLGAPLIGAADEAVGSRFFESHTPGAEQIVVRKSRTLRHLSLAPRSEQQDMFKTDPTAWLMNLRLVYGAKVAK